ncbi:MAG TPA: EAL domain-containing protein [Alphaproteobacteria bacterium]|nr:EAL domain-containing protein [Alphaproteobacteria bacterium]
MSSGESAESSVILIVDDDATMRFLMRETLEQDGFTVVESGDGAEALQAFEESRPKMLISDVVMPVMDGFELCRELRKRRDATYVPVLMATGLDDLESIERAYEAGATDFIVKPINWLILSHRVRYMLRASRAFNELRETEERMRSIAENLPGAIFRQVLKRDGKMAYTYVSPAMQILYGIDPEGMVRDSSQFMNIVVPEDRAGFDDALRHSAHALTPMEVEFRLQTPIAGVRWLKSIARPRRLEDGEVQWDGVALDITELKKLEAHRDYLAYYDPLTGMPNQQLFEDRLSQALPQAQRLSTKIAVIYLELESLENIRDSSGLAAADGIIREAALRLQPALRPGDTVAHAGGGRFFAMLGGIKRSTDVAAPIRRLTEAFETPFVLDGSELYAKVVMGISLCPDDGEAPEALLRNASTALTRARATLGQGYEFYSRHMTESAVKRLGTEGELRRAIEREELLVYYQPQVHTVSFKIIGMEALVRWRHPTRGLVPPGEFIPIAEQSGLIVPLGEYVLRMACVQTQAWQRAGICDFPVSVNVSGWQLMREDLGDRVLSILKETGLPHAGLKLELTESTILRNVELVTRTMNRLAATGITFAVDDFGIEHSALSYLSRLPVETLKVDHSFVSRMTADPAHGALVQAIISMTHAMDKKAIAEGVESNEELTYMRAYRCNAIQGFLFSKPKPPAEFEKLLTAEVLPPRQAAE